MDRFAVLICLAFTLSLGPGFPVAAEAQSSSPSRSRYKKHRIANRPPIINSFTPSTSEVYFPCPCSLEDLNNYSSNFTTIIPLSVKASDPDGDTLVYRYFVSGGRIVGKGEKVEWNLSGLHFGAYTVIIEVNDRHGRRASKTVDVRLYEPALGGCDCFGPTVNVTCPESVEDGQSITFTLNITGGLPRLKPVLNWSVSAGAIIKGQGTDKIEVSTSGLARQHLTATVKIGGFEPAWTNTASCETQIREKSLDSNNGLQE